MNTLYLECEHCKHAAAMILPETVDEGLRERDIPNLCPPVMKHDMKPRITNGADIPMGVTLRILRAPVRYDVTRDPDDALKSYVTLHVLNESYRVEVRTDSWTHDNGFRAKILERGYQIFANHLMRAYGMGEGGQT